MTDLPLPDELADGVVAGDVVGAPAELAGVAELFARAAQPGTADELRGLAAISGEFAAVAMTPRRAGRVSRRALAAVAGVLLTAGTAAAATGVLTSGSDSEPAPTSAAAPEQGLDDEESSTSSSEPTVEENEESDDDSATSSSEASEESENPDTSTSEPQGPDASGPAAYGLCTAWSNGAPKNTDNPAFGALVAAAEEAGVSVDEYCAAVMADKETGRGNDDGESDDETDPAEETGNNGNGNGQGNGNGNGNGQGNGQGNGNGNNGQGNGNGNQNGKGGQNGNG